MKYLVCIVLLLGSFSSFGQIKTIKGTVVDSTTNAPLELVTIIARGSVLENPIKGTTTFDDGSFQIDLDSNEVILELRFMGYRTKMTDKISLISQSTDIGTIQLGSSVQSIEEVSVRADKSTTEFKLDKRVFNVGQDLSSSGASALEVLNNVPSVTVSIEGIISLRGSSGVQILIDGKPSVLADDQSNALGTITAEMIDRIEVITNPSAKYESEGTAGIINIILKKDEKKGANGSISINTGWPHNHSIGFSLNRRTEHFNLFTQIGAGYRSLPHYNKASNNNLIDSTIIESEGINYRNEQFYNLILGTDYYINDRNIITLSGNVAYEIEEQPSSTTFKRTQNNILVSEWERNETTSALNPKYQYDLQYKKEFKDSNEHTLLFSTLGQFFGKSQSSMFDNRLISGTASYYPQQTRTHFTQADYTFKLDYTKPFRKGFTLETGAQYVMNDVGNDYEVQNNYNDVWVTNDSLTNNFIYKQKVLGIYATGSYEGKKWGLKLGLRGENTDLKTELTTTNVKNNVNYTNFFPSIHTSYKISRYISLQAGYSRRIYRPRLWDLNPFFNITNNFNIRRGNPELQPEFTDSYELMSIYIFKKASLNIGAYYRYTTEVIERISVFENNVNTTMPMNIGTNDLIGGELNFKYTPIKWLTINGDLNYNYFNRKGSFDSQVFDFKGDKWIGQLTSKFKITKNIDFELSGNYESAYKTIQGRRGEMFYMNSGLRVKIMKGKGVINAGVRDIFASRIERTYVNQTNYVLESTSMRGRFITFGFSYGFGKGEAMTYSGARHR